MQFMPYPYDYRCPFGLGGEAGVKANLHYLENLLLDPESGATCKDIAAKLAYAEELKANKAKELYNKMRNRYQMRCSRAPGNQKMRDDYNAWRKQAQIALSKYQLGEIGWEEFEKIIRDNL